MLYLQEHGPFDGKMPCKKGIFGLERPTSYILWFAAGKRRGPGAGSPTEDRLSFLSFLGGKSEQESASDSTKRSEKEQNLQARIASRQEMIKDFSMQGSF